jgi:hypothetical protein
MSTTKRITGDYLITNKDTLNANVIISTGTLFVDGNLQIGGNSQSISHTNTDITDNIIVLNKGETGPGVSTPGFSGINIDRGTGQFVPGVRWDENLSAWQATNDGTTYKYIQLGSSPSANVYGDSADSTNGSVQLFANTANSGGSGIYVTNTATTNAELVTKAKAIAFSIIFG